MTEPASTPAPTTTSIGVEARVDGDVGRILLDRPKALNALTTAMVERLEEVLTTWAEEPLRAIVIESSSDRAFSAGGDIRQVRENTLAGDLDASRHFFATEYRVNHLLGTSRVPVVALVDGACMGGGMGLSVHGDFCVVGSRLAMAMPETTIGFFPDVGATHVLPRLEGEVGTYLGLTGARLAAADAVAVGLATHHVPSDGLGALADRIVADGRPVAEVIAEAAVDPGPSELATHRDEIDRLFSAPSVDVLLEALRSDRSSWGRETLGVLEGVSRQSLEITLDLLRRGAGLSLRECLDLELRATEQVVQSPDFIEGVRAVLVDKDRSPTWGRSQYRGLTADGEIRWT
ncbi:enoyl-CoA hydratase/isomerase family protein [Aeromicrobium sp. Leaf350]|uniref:enoyl-CoA hydratase/isomerase family protein n=1 Tax=Aeromicrobium sp. Leaf350 TaxID=2876565 RepID=UPI001E36284E|nr:enoyl-CoA hydratase/isomerase family protein [Aeromicrobium sp. Leaf350]